MLIYCKLNMSEQNSVKFEYLKYIDIFSCDQTVLGMVQSVRPSVCPSVRPSHFLTVFPSSHHHDIFRTDYHCQKWCQCKRSEVKVQVQVTHAKNNQFKPISGFRVSIPVKILRRLWNYAKILVVHRRGVPFLSKPYVQFQGHTCQ